MPLVSLNDILYRRPVFNITKSSTAAVAERYYALDTMDSAQA